MPDLLTAITIIYCLGAFYTAAVGGQLIAAASLGGVSLFGWLLFILSVLFWPVAWTIYLARLI